MLRAILIMLLLSTLFSCDSTYTEPKVMYRFDKFDTRDIKKVESFMHEVADRWNLSITEKDRDQKE